MRIFIKRILLFFIVGVLFLLATYFFLTFYLNQQANFQLNPNKKILILGHSHPERAYNDSLIPNTINLASAAESYLYTLAKTRKIIQKNSQIHTVFIECTNNQFSVEMDDWTWGNKMSNRLHLYAPFLNFKETKQLFLKNPMLFIESSSVFFRKSFEKILSADYDYIGKIGGYYWNDLKLEKEPNSNAKMIFNFEVSYNNISYLKKIITFLNSKDVEVILVRTPTLEAYNYRYSNEQYSNIIKEEFNNIQVLDFSAYDMKYSYYGDSQHMNNIGSRKFSKWFASLLSKGLLQETNKQAFIDREIEVWSKSCISQED